MAYKFYNNWKNLVNRKQRSLDEQKHTLEVWNQRLEKARQEEAEGKKTYGMGVKYWEKEIKSTSKKIEKLEVELKTILENIPEDVQSEINRREEIFSTFSDFISFLEKTWNDRDERLKKECNDWLDDEMKKLKESYHKIEEAKRQEFKEMEIPEGHKRWAEEIKFIDKVKLTYYITPGNKILEKAGFRDFSEYDKIRTSSIEDLKKENLENAQQSVLSLVDRVEDRVGKVSNWSNLHFGSNGMLNGRVTGNLGSTYVETIPAGGYNIQRFHYRVLLKK